MTPSFWPEPLGKMKLTFADMRKTECQQLRCGQLSCGAPGVDMASSHPGSGEQAVGYTRLADRGGQAGDLSLDVEHREGPQPRDCMKAPVWDGKRSGSGTGLWVIAIQRLEVQEMRNQRRLRRRGRWKVRQREVWKASKESV